MKHDINHEYVSISSHTATHRIILIHGWGADADDLLTLGKEITEKIDFDFEVISLRAPGLHPSGQGRQWYGLYPHDWHGAEVEAKKLLSTLILSILFLTISIPNGSALVIKTSSV